MVKRYYLFIIFVVASFMMLVVPSSFAEEEARFAAIKTMKGMVEVKIANSDWLPAQEGMVLHIEDEIRTGKDSMAELVLDEAGATGWLEIKEMTRMKLNTLDLNSLTGEKRTMLDVAIGRVMVHVEKLEGDSKFEVRTPTATMGVRGTVFEVIVEEEKKEAK